jgi:hypothetical protein
MHFVGQAQLVCDALFQTPFVLAKLPLQKLKMNLPIIFFFGVR